MSVGGVWRGVVGTNGFTVNERSDEIATFQTRFDAQVMTAILADIWEYVGD